MSSKAKRLVLFNHKGGVGKTTLTVNIAAAIASLGQRVLLVDTDPQCNVTTYLIADEVVDDFLDKSDSSTGRTIWTAVKPLSEGTGDVISIGPIETGIHGLYILPGDIQLSAYESELEEYWKQSLQRRMKGYRGTTAISRVVSDICEASKIDYVFYDTGPNIGPLNRVIMLDCDWFIVPVACDLFSIRGLKTLGRALSGWIQEWSTISALAPDGVPLLSGMPAFLGYILQNFRIYRGEIVAQGQKLVPRIDKDVRANIYQVLKLIDESLTPRRMSDLRLGQVRSFPSLAIASQQEGLPIFDVKTGTSDQRDAARMAFLDIAKAILAAPSSENRR